MDDLNGSEDCYADDYESDDEYYSDDQFNNKQESGKEGGNTGEQSTTTTNDDKASDHIDRAPLDNDITVNSDTDQDDAENDLSNNKTITLPLSTQIKTEKSCTYQGIPKAISALRGEDELRYQLWESSKRLVREGEKNVTLALDLKTSKNDLCLLRKELNEMRTTLLRGINEGELDSKKYSNIPLLELLRIRIQECGKDIMKHSVNSCSWGFRRKVAKTSSDAQSSSGNNEARVKPAKPSDTIVNKLKERIIDMAERSRKEREIRSKLHREIGIGNEKVEALSDHIEKLMVHLKYEALSKARALADRTRAVREISLLKKRNEVMEKRNQRKDKVLAELKDSAKILEDQLQLMDEKYMELRIKLDWSRTHTERMIKKKDEQVRELRSKFVLATDLMAKKGKKQKGTLLDNCKLGKKFNQIDASGIKKKGMNSLNVGQQLPSTDDAVT